MQWILHEVGEVFVHHDALPLKDSDFLRNLLPHDTYAVNREVPILMIDARDTAPKAWIDRIWQLFGACYVVTCSVRLRPTVFWSTKPPFVNTLGATAVFRQQGPADSIVAACAHGAYGLVE